MNFHTFFTGLDVEQKQTFSEHVGTSVEVLKQYSGGHRRFGPARAQQIVAAAKKMFPRKPARQLTLYDVRPDIWTR